MRANQGIQATSRRRQMIKIMLEVFRVVRYIVTKGGGGGALQNLVERKARNTIGYNQSRPTNGNNVLG